MQRGLSAFLDLALFVRQLNCRTGHPKYGVLRVREKKKKKESDSPWCGLSRFLGVP